MEVTPLDESYRKRPKYLVPVVFDKDETAETEVTDTADQTTFACIIGDSENTQLKEALTSLNLIVCHSKDGIHLSTDVPDGSNIVFVVKEFKGRLFDNLLKQKYRIVGNPCVEFCVSKEIPLLDRKRPVYSCTMDGVIACLTGFRNDKELARELCDMIHWMGGSVRNKVSSAVTHIVAKNVIGANYKNAVSFGIDIMSQEWVYKSWEERENIKVSATDANLMVYKQLPFLGCHLALFGFTDTEASHVTDIAQSNGGVICDIADESLTHLVVANGVDTLNLPATIPSRTHIVKQQWFWESIQIEACADEAVYYAKERPRKRYSIHNASANSFISMDSLLEASLVSLSSPITRQVAKSDTATGVKKPSALATAATPTTAVTATGGGSGTKEDVARYHIVMELFQTETNFVKILKMIVNEFMIPLEQPGQRGGQLLTHENVKSIFGNIPDILTVHTNIMSGLEQRTATWTSESCVGDVFLDQADELLRVYPPYINYFEVTKEALMNCDRQYPRFHAFLKCNESRPDCGRQTLAELLITPVQRIPRIILLLQDLLKHTDKSHWDYEPLQKAVDSLKTVMDHINEDKRKTEKQMHMFELVREIEDIPATVLSSHRSFIGRYDVTELNTTSGKNSKTLSIALFLFSDSIEIAKIRSGHGLSAMKGPFKPFRHLEFLTYTSIRSLVDFADSEDIVNGFGMLVHWPEDPQERLLTFKVNGGDKSVKDNVLRQLSQLICDANCATAPDDFIWKTSSEILHSMSRTGDTGTIKRALADGLKGMRRKVKRTISNRSVRRPFTPLSRNIDTGLEPMDESFTECDTTLNISSSSVAPPYAFTPTPLKAPPTKRQALGAFGHSFSTMDLTRLGSNATL